MHDAVFIIAMVWFIGLCAALAVVAGRDAGVAPQAVAFDTLSYVIVAALVVIAIHRGEAGFLDIAVVIAALGFVQTVAITRLVTGREPPP